MIQNVLVPILVIIIIQLGINLGLGFLVKERFLRGYRIITYIAFIGFAFSIPFIQILRLFIALKSNGAPDAVAISSGHETVMFWIVNLIAMTCIQLIFNTFFLKRIVLRKQTK